MSGIFSILERYWSGSLALLHRAYPWHRALFIGLNGVLTVANIVTGPPWWGLWPLLITGLLFALHYFLYKSTAIDDAWVEERVEDVRVRSLDHGHVGSLIERKSEIDKSMVDGPVKR